MRNYIRSSYLLRLGTTGLGCVSIWFHGWDNGDAIAFWVALLLQSLVYPNLLLLHSLFARDSRKAQLYNLHADALCLGLWVAALKFPLWIGFAAFMTIAMANTISQGVRGIARAMLFFFGGMLVSMGFFGFSLSPATGWPTTWISVVGITVFVMAVADIAYRRNQQLSKAREALRLGEHTLQQQLSSIQLLQAQLKEQATQDPLTGLHNRRFLDTVVSREMAHCDREGLPMSVMMIDIDHFKQVNDTYGHPAGDEVLRGLAALLMEKVRASDVVCRWGGEEFLILLPCMAPDIALQRADQWRACFADISFNLGAQTMRATLSIGVAVYPGHGDSLLELTHCADHALYRAKHDGRNRVVLYQQELDTTQPGTLDHEPGARA